MMLMIVGGVVNFHNKITDMGDFDDDDDVGSGIDCM